MCIFAHIAWHLTFMPSIVSLLPSLLLTTRYYYPRQVLIPHFWTPSQQVAFRGVYHGLRAEHHTPVLQGMQKTSSPVQDGHLQNRLQHLCAKVSQSLLNLVFLSVNRVPLLSIMLYIIFVKGFRHRTSLQTSQCAAAAEKLFSQNVMQSLQCGGTLILHVILSTQTFPLIVWHYCCHETSSDASSSVMLPEVTACFGYPAEVDQASAWATAALHHG